MTTTPAAKPPAATARPIYPHPPSKTWTAPPPMTIDPKGKYTASLATSDGTIGVELLPGVAPNAVNNFVFLAKEGFYKDTPIHRMIPGFMFQSGDPTGTGSGGSGYDIPDDPVPSHLKYTKGTLAMANTGQPNTGGSQFFVMLGDYPLPPTYTIFGKVTSGLDVLGKIEARKVTDNGMGEVSKPVDPIGIEDITVTGP
jgi:cyclophilin family peptidyl-prolyl cis-trans isomerase